jgi:hypothetical protein
LIKKQGNRKANIKKTKRIRRGGGGREKQGEEKKVGGGGGTGLSLLQQVGGWEKQGRRTNGAKGREGGGERKRGKRKGRVRGLTQWF